MERHIEGLERELEGVQGELCGSEESARAAVGRWRAAERAVLDLQDQLERMERGAREEAERQAEVIGRLERQRELSSAAVRLKGAAAVKSLGATEGSSAVSSFVRDLLQDNAGLQVGIAELRELLSSSREEIQTLRECLADHQPAQDNPALPSLGAELGFPLSPPRTEEPSRQVHIHHHYHAAPKERKKKRRSARFGPVTPSSSRPPSVVTVESDARDAEVWSPGRELEDSLASSPRSDPRASVFDRAEEPLSPCTSVEPLSPGKRLLGSSPPVALLDDVGRGALGEPSAALGEPSAALDSVALLGEPPAGPDPVAECPLAIPEMEAPEDIPESTDSETPTALHTPRTLRRAHSHESIVSLGGLDIHTLRSRPSQLTLGQLGGAQAVLTDITAQPTISRSGGRGSSVLRDNLAALPSARAPSGSSAKTRWNWRPWRAPGAEPAGDAETGSSSTLESSGPRDVPAGSAKDKGLGGGTPKGSLRSPGINQPGAIPGFGELMARAGRKRAGDTSGDASGNAE